MIRRSLLWGLAGATVVGLTSTGTLYDLSKSDWAAWVQAVGAIIAIFGAFLIAQRQHQGERRLEKNRRDADERQRFKILLAILTKTETTVNWSVEQRQKNIFMMPPENSDQLFIDCENLLGSVAPIEMPHEDLVLICHGIQQEIPIIRRGYTLWRQQIEHPTPRINTRDAETDKSIKDALALAKEGCDLCLREIAART